MRVVPFSNGTEFENWKKTNCDKCTRYENESTNYATAGCPAAFDIDMGTILGNIRLVSAQQIGCTNLGSQYVRLNDKCKMFKK